MTNLNNIKDLGLIYSTIKKVYKYKQDTCIIKQIDMSYFNEFKRILVGDGYFDWSFAIDYFNNSNNKCYKVTYKNITF